MIFLKKKSTIMAIINTAIIFLWSYYVGEKISLGDPGDCLQLACMMGTIIILGYLTASFMMNRPKSLLGFWTLMAFNWLSFPLLNTIIYLEIGETLTGISCIIVAIPFAVLGVIAPSIIFLED